MGSRNGACTGVLERSPEVVRREIARALTLASEGLEANHPELAGCAMPWIRATFNENQVWVEVDDAGRLKAQGGRVAMRYSESAGAKISRAGVSRVTPHTEAKPEALPEGTSADAPAKKPAARKRPSGLRG